MAEEDEEMDFALAEHVINHPMDSFNRFASLAVGDSYAKSFAYLLNELATHTVVETDSTEELLEFAESVGKPMMGVISTSGDKGMGVMSMADPNTGKVSPIFGGDRIENIENRLDQTEETINDLPDSKTIKTLIRESQNYDYEESKHVEMAKRTWDLINVDDFMNRSNEFNVVDGGYFRDNIMDDPTVASEFAGSDVGMAAVFAVDELVN